MNQKINSLLNFIHKTPSPFHIFSSTKDELQNEQKNVELLNNLIPDQFNEKKIYLYSKGGALVVFQLKPITDNTRFHIWGAHSDSPSLKIRSYSNRRKNNLNFLKTEVYGSPIISTWLDRTFSLAGKIYYQEENKVKKILINFDSPLATIANAAIHINQEVNKSFRLDKEKHLLAIVGCHEKNKQPIETIIAEELKIKSEAILAYDLQLNPLEKPTLLGVNREMIHAPRLDNLLMCHAGIIGFLEHLKMEKSNPDIIPMLCFFNHEEIGSRSNEGAWSFNLLKNIMDGILKGQEINKKNKIVNNSFFISADVAHAFHPQFSEFYEEGNNILFEKGVVIKHSSNRNYVSESEGVALIKNLLLKKKIAFQEANSHGEIPCGSTIGPIVNSQLGIKTLDLGSALLAMHSLKELGSVQDHLEMIKLVKFFFIEFLLNKKN